MSRVIKLGRLQRVRWAWFAVTSLWYTVFGFFRLDPGEVRLHWQLTVHYITGVYTGCPVQPEDSDTPWKA